MILKEEERKRGREEEKNKYREGPGGEIRQQYLVKSGNSTW
jgi:hypothetical protein